METQIFHHAKIIIIFQKSSKRNQNLSRYYYYNSIITNLKFQQKPKYHHLSKILISKQNYLIIITQGPKSPYATIVYNESKHNILPCLGRQGQQSAAANLLVSCWSETKLEQPKYHLLLTSPINWKRCLPSAIFFFLQRANLIGPSLKKNETMLAPHN